MIEKAVNEGNHIYTQNGVKQRINSVAVHEITASHRISGKIKYQLINGGSLARLLHPNLFINKEEEILLKNIVSWRKATKADVVVYLDSNSGQGVANLVRGPHTTHVVLPEGSFRVTTLLHELGHCQGLRHEMGAIVPYDRTSQSYRTIMATNCINELKATEEVSIFSGPNSFHNNNHMYSPCFWNSVDILNKTAQKFSQYGERFANEEPIDKVIHPKGELKDIAYGFGCFTLGVFEDQGLWEWKGYEWSKIPNIEYVKDVEIGSGNKIYVVLNDNRLYAYNLNSQKLNKIKTPKEKVKEVSASTDGELWIINKKKNVFKFVNGFWKKKESSKEKSWKEIAIGSKNEVWAIGKSGKVYKWKNGKWVKKYSEKSEKISVGSDSTVGIITKSNEILVKYGTQEFQKVKINIPATCNSSVEKLKNNPIAQGKADKIIVSNENRIGAISNGLYYEHINKNGFLRAYDISEKL